MAKDVALYSEGAKVGVKCLVGRQTPTSHRTLVEANNKSHSRRRAYPRIYPRPVLSAQSRQSAGTHRFILSPFLNLDPFLSRCPSRPYHIDDGWGTTRMQGQLTGQAHLACLVRSNQDDPTRSAVYRDFPVIPPITQGRRCYYRRHPLSKPQP